MVISFSHPDQVMYRTGSRIVIWDLSRNASVWMFDSDGYPLAISSDRTCVASCNNFEVVKIWQADNAIGNRDMARPSIYAHVYCVALSGDGLLIASGHKDGTARLWQATSGLCLDTFRGHSNEIHSVIFSPDSRLCASSSYDYTIRVWDVHTRAIISTLNVQDSASSIVFSPNCSQLLFSQHSTSPSEDGYITNHYIVLWEAATGECLASTQIEGDPTTLVFDGDGTSVIANFGSSAMTWKIFPATKSNHKSPDGDNKNDHSLLPMVFVPIHDLHPPLSTDVSSHQHCYQRGSKWILDEQKRRVCWVLPDLRGLSNDSNGKMVAFGSHSGMVTIVDTSGV